MAKPRNQTAIEDYLKTVFSLQEWGGEQAAATNADVAAALGVATSSASEMVRKLTGLGYVDHQKYGSIQLTDAGVAHALEMVRRHRLIETYLVSRLGYSWDEVHDEAEVLEHAVSPLMVDRMDAALGHPWRDPHGDPIPTPDGVLHQPTARPLALLEVDERGFVARIDDEDPAMLRWFGDHGLGLDTEVVLRERRPFGGATVVTLAGTSEPVDLGDHAAAALWLTTEPPHEPQGSRGSQGCHYDDCQHLGADPA